ncbi:MAG: hypothetical protein PHH35_01345 [Candidatus Pacebacteria bacterium]|nr:hypothetical protein [Candidatus Paceibacterota bacterium]
MKEMRKRLLILVVLMVLFLGACRDGAIIPSVTEDIEIWVTGFEQEVFCNNAKGVTRVFNGDLPKDLTRCYGPPSCCPPCNCPVCEVCEECSECPTCPSCGPCCCYLKWGNVYVDYKMKNLGLKDLTVKNVCFEITFEDNTKTVKCVELQEGLLEGEVKGKQAKFTLSPVKRVIYVVVQKIEYY